MPTAEAADARHDRDTGPGFVTDGRELVRSNAAAVPSLFAARLVEWRAERISDPVERLRFLRKTAPYATLPGKRLYRILVILSSVLLMGGFALPPIIRSFRSLQGSPVAVLLRPGAAPAADRVADVWQVERKPDYEIYSNGLRVETQGAVFEQARKYAIAPRQDAGNWSRPRLADLRIATSPAGIVYHTTESHIAPFRSAEIQSLQRAGRGVLAYVRQARAYHYLIDRFGRVHRVVDEASVANHAGWSVWADSRNLYLALNYSFLGVSFEAQTRPQDGSETINPAQVRAGQMITEMLRSKYKIAAANCVTHAQVSVNPDNFLVGAHTDWATRFPFAALGLPDNYATPLPSISLFGFQYDNTYVAMSEAGLWKGLLLGSEEVRLAATARGLRAPVYRALLNHRYTELMELMQKKRTEDGN
ncbi:MAG: N-acetylmuramoyl-L-alanine amidase [Bryobacterales bacterium]|nr:N-acetylmuramoyl-L-alanine amidase [Bryobacterales bacterium]